MDRSTRDQRDRCLAAFALRRPAVAIAGAIRMPIEPKTSQELREIVADLAGLSPSVINVHKIADVGNFGATVIAGVTSVGGGAHQSNVEAICDRLRLKYRLKDG